MTATSEARSAVFEDLVVEAGSYRGENGSSDINARQDEAHFKPYKEVISVVVIEIRKTFCAIPVFCCRIRLLSRNISSPAVELFLFLTITSAVWPLIRVEIPVHEEEVGHHSVCY